VLPPHVPVEAPGLSTSPVAEPSLAAASLTGAASLIAGAASASLTVPASLCEAASAGLAAIVPPASLTLTPVSREIGAGLNTGPASNEASGSAESALIALLASAIGGRSCGPSTG
jgi:hypothetical protein